MRVSVASDRVAFVHNLSCDLGVTIDIGAQYEERGFDVFVFERQQNVSCPLARTVVEKNEVLAKRDEALGKLKLQVSVLQGLHTNQLAGNFVLVEEIIAQSEAIESLQEDRENALQLAYTDPLTGLFTRHGERVITAQLATLKPAGHRTAADAVTVLALDLDRFKSCLLYTSDAADE